MGWVLSVAAIVGCGLLVPGDGLVDGWSVGGEQRDCTAQLEAEACLVARIALGFKPLPPRTRITLHHEGTYPAPDGGQLLMTRSGSVTVVLLTSEDSTRRAIGVHCGVGDCFVVLDPPGN